MRMYCTGSAGPRHRGPLTLMGLTRPGAPAWAAARQAAPAGQPASASTSLASRTPLPSAEPPSDDGLPLTKREFQVALLIVEGLTNRQIGERLFIAERTVDTHVGRILGKLACSSRSQVSAMIAVRRIRRSLGIEGPLPARSVGSL
jgi:DNA-binding NarL/FixJ family response regulator